MRKRVIFLVLAVAIILPSTIWATGQSETTGGKTTLRVAWWGNPTRDERTLKVIDMYQQKYPNVTIEPETVGWGGYWDRINTQVASGNMPDVMQHDYAYLLQFAGRDLMADMTPFVQDKTIDLTGVDESYLSGGRVNGKLYGISLGTNAVCLVYDPAVLQKAGVAEPTASWTWADFEAMAKKIYTATGVQTIPFFTTDPKVGFENWIRQTGKPFFNPNGKSLGFFDPAPLEEYFNIQLRLQKAGALVSPEVAFVNTTPQEGPLAKGNSWVDYVWSNQVVSTVDAAKRPLKIALLPKIAGAVRPGTYLKPSMFFSIPASSQNKVEAAKFVNYFLTDSDANKVLLGERGVPIIPGVRSQVKSAVDPVMQNVFDYIGLVGNGNASPIDPPDPAGTGEVLKMFRDTTQEVLT
ncbi:MAG TPA: extracellular solute-binding protein, partial [Spirochaetia bacterium]|nr:extracellular solute-binding protein [Spirochaetia bacterium]